MLKEANEEKEVVYYDLKKISIIIEFSEFPLEKKINRSLESLARLTEARRHGNRNDNNGEQRNSIKEY